MSNDVHTASNGKNLTTLLSEMKDEIKEFLQTRITMLQIELREKGRTLKSVAPTALAAVLFLGTAYLLFTMAVVALIVAAFPANPYRWFFGFLAVAILSSFCGAAAAYFAKRELNLNGLIPKRTIEVLKSDKRWVQSEVRNQI